MITYKDAGVDVERGYEAVRRMKQHVAATFDENVLGGLGSFGGFYSIENENVEKPVLVAGTDGVSMQKSVPVLEGDTPETLAARVLAVEHEILPESVRLFCAEKLGVDGRQVHVL